MLIRIAILVAVFSVAFADESNYCEDGWDLYSVKWGPHEHHSCFYFGSRREQLSYANAEAVCNSYGAYLNSWIVHKLLEKNRDLEKDGLGRPHFETQYWLGAKDYGHHSSHMPGTWVWEHRNTTVKWFDWGHNEPNNWDGQNCLTYLLYQDIVGFRNFQWK